MADSIAIIGTGGTNSRLWTGAFLQAGWSVRALVRDAANLAARPNQTPVRFDLDDAGGFEIALREVTVLALVTPADPRQVERESQLIRAARRAGVNRILKVSVTGANLAAPISQFARWAAQIERELIAAAIPHVVLRPNLYMQNLLRQRASIEAGTYAEPLGASARITLLDVRDIAAVAVGVAGGGFDGRALELTGAHALTGAEIAGTLAQTIGRPVRFVSPDLEALRADLEARGMPAWRSDSQLEIYRAVQEGRAPHLAIVSPDVQAVTGRAPRTLQQFAHETFGPGAGG